MRKSARVLIPGAARRKTLPPFPPSPPSGPPKGTNFSRRKLVLPRPPLPACTRARASSTNFIGGLYRSNENPGARPGLCSILEAPAARSGLLGQHAHVHALLGALLLEVHLAGHLGEQRVIGSYADVRARTHLRAALADDDVAGQHLLAPKALHAEALGVGIAAVLGTAACLFVCHDSILKMMGASAAADLGHLHFGEGLAVRLLPQVVRAALELHHRHFRAPAVAHDGREHLAALERGTADLDLGPLADQEHFAKFDGGAGLRVELLDAQHAILGHSILLAARGDDCVHGRRPGENERPRILLSHPPTVKPPFPEWRQGLTLSFGPPPRDRPSPRSVGLSSGVPVG